MEVIQEYLGNQERKPYGKMTVTELREVAEQFSINLPRRATKEQIRTAILEWERQAMKSAKEAPPAKKTAPKKDKPLPVPQQAPSTKDGLTAGKIISKLGGSKSEVKAASFITAADSLGWKLDGTRSEGDHTEVTVKRGPESIHIGWVGGVFIYDECLYSNAGRGTIKLRNASAAKKRMAMSPDEASEEASRIQNHHHREPSDDGGKDSPVKRQRRPKFNEGMRDDEILDAVYGRRITFVNRISGEEDHDYVPRPQEVRRVSNRPRIEESRSGRVLTFTGSSGYRSVLVQSIVAVK